MSQLAAHRLGLQKVHDLDGRRTVDRCRSGAPPLVVHGTLAIRGFPPRAASSVSARARGLVVRTSLALGQDCSPLGVLAARSEFSPPVRADSGLLSPDGIALLPEVHHTEVLLTGTARRPLHVLDGSGDDDALIAELHGRSLRYVVRLPNAGHLVQAPGYLQAFVSKRPTIVLRNVETMGSASHGGSRGGRGARDAVLALWAAPVELPSHGSVVRRARSPVNLVTVVELHRSPVEAPIGWHLATSERVQSAEEVVAIVDAYRSYALLRDLFEALREGCRIEERSTTPSTTIDDALGIFLPIAFRLLALRHLPRSEPCTVLSSRQIRVLASELSGQLPPRPTNVQVCRALAEFGGAPGGEGVPSWTFLGLGLERLFLRELARIAGASAPYSASAPNAAAEWLQ